MCRLSTNFSLFGVNHSHQRFTSSCCAIRKTMTKNKPTSKPGCWVGPNGKSEAKLTPEAKIVSVQILPTLKCLPGTRRPLRRRSWGCLQGFCRPSERNLGYLQLCCCTRYLTDFKEHSLDQSTAFSLRNFLNVYNLVGFSCSFSFIFILQLCRVHILLYFGFQLLLKSIIKTSIITCLSITCKCIGPWSILSD